MLNTFSTLVRSGALGIIVAGAVMATAPSSLATAYTASCAVDNAACQSAFQTLGNNSATGSGSDQVNWGLFAISHQTLINNGSIQTNDSTLTPGNDQVTVKSGDGNGFATYTEGNGAIPTQNGRTFTAGSPWNGLFPAGTTILATSDGTITLSFSSALIGLGLDAQIFNAGTYTETLTAYNSLGQELATVTQSGTSLAAANGGVKSGEGTVPFVGISTDTLNNAQSLATDGISYVTISTACTSTNCSTGGFAIDTSVLYHYPIASPDAPTATPEPGTLGLLGVGLAGLGLLRRRRV
jgi:hypothetical protein